MALELAIPPLKVTSPPTKARVFSGATVKPRLLLGKISDLPTPSTLIAPGFCHNCKPTGILTVSKVEVDGLVALNSLPSAK